MNFEKFVHQIVLNSYLCSNVSSQCHQSSSAAFSEWLPKQWCCTSVSIWPSFILLCTANLSWTPNIFKDSGPPIKGIVGGLIRGALDPANPPYGGRGAKIFLEGF